MLLMLLPFHMVPVRGLMQKKADHFSSSDVFTERPGKNFFAKQCFSCYLLSMLFFPVRFVFSESSVQNSTSGNC